MEKEKKEGYNVLNSKELIELSMNKEGSLVEQIEFNEAVIEELNDGSYLIMPQGTFKGLNVYNKELLDSMVVNNEYPKETDSGSFFELFKHKIECLNDELSFFHNQFLEYTYLEYDYDLPNEFIDKLGVKFNNFSQSEKDNIIPIFSILLNESFRRKVDGVWVFSKQYSLNTFKIPSIQDKQGTRINLNKLIFDELSKKGKVDIKETLIHLVDSYVMQRANVNDFNRVELYNSLRLDFETNFKKYLEIASKLK